MEIKTPIIEVKMTGGTRGIQGEKGVPGKDGEGRKIGYNWRVDDDTLDSYKNNVEKYITSRQDVYSKTPLYSVTLTPSIIKEIRKYNKDNDYGDNSTLSCDENGYHCYSTFLRNEKFSNMIDQNK